MGCQGDGHLAGHFAKGIEDREVSRGVSDHLIPDERRLQVEESIHVLPGDDRQMLEGDNHVPRFQKFELLRGGPADSADDIRSVVRLFRSIDDFGAGLLVVPIR